MSVVYERLVYQIYQADAVPKLLRQFLRDKEILFCGAAINNDARMLAYYGLDIACMCDL